jgi:tetratricopeptide (TPR) repeat protein
MLPRYRSDLERIALSEIGSREAKLKADAAAPRASPRAHNSLGVLYASYGLIDRAEGAFQAALASGRYVPALANLGNVRYAQGRYAEAMAMLSEARAAEPGNGLVLAALSRAALAAGDRAASEEAYAALSVADPQLAASYSYLAKPAGDSTRAAATIGVSAHTEWLE